MAITAKNSDKFCHKLSKAVLIMSDLGYSSSIAYFRGKFIPARNANINIASSPVLYGLSVYTVLGAHWNEESKNLNVFRLKDHYQRLINSAKIMNFDDFSKLCTYEEFQSTIIDLLKKNNVKENVHIRATIFIDELMSGTKMQGLRNSWAAFIYPMHPVLPEAGANVCVSSWVRTSDNAIPARAKVNGNYVNASLMKNEAIKNGYDDAIALDSLGHVAEGTVANIFLVRDGVLITPDHSTDILEGITRDTVFALANQLGIECERRPVDRTELYIADEIFYSGSSAKITPILSVDRQTIGNGKAGSLTQKLIQGLADAQLGKLPTFADWLTDVY